MKSHFWVLISIILGAFSYFGSDLFTDGLSHQQKSVICTLVIATTLWVSEALPLFVTSLASSLLLIVLAGFPTKKIFTPYFSPVIVLFFGGFLLARAMQKFKLDEMSAHLLLAKVSKKPSLFLLAIMSFTAFLSLWMSNTASAAIMIPIAIVILKDNDLLKPDKKSPYSKALILGVAYAATLGGIGSLVGSPPNAIAVNFLAENQIELNFVDWMLFALPFMIIAIIIAWRILLFINPPEIKNIIYCGTKIEFGIKHKLTMAIFAMTVLGWLTTPMTGLSSSTVALLAAVSLFVLGVLDEKDLRKISWETLLLFGGGLSLGNALTDAGAGEWVVANFQTYFLDFHILIMLFVFVAIAVLMTMVASNTAAAAILIPLVLPLAKPLGLPPQILAVLIAIGVSLDFMMPVGTPPSAIAHSTGFIRVPEMIKNGVLVNIITSLLLVVLYYFFYI